ncbi:polyprenyl synthetase family protein [Nocardia sp. SYP-A9097]|uniref:polyprenyl synthetase family protein n=1 Tax=Nocardia sp. SYP-A9097 TaxID=2663237 RepID=UPI0035C8A88A
MQAPHPGTATPQEDPLSAGPGTPTRQPVGAGSLVAAVQERLAKFFVTRQEILAPLGPVVADASRALEEFVLRGGKRTRPAFAWTGWLGAGRSATDPQADAVLTACAALELVQAAALIHDDIIDSSRTRRGFPTVHMDYETRHRDGRWAGDPAHYGASIAILIGDLALAWADDMTRGAGLDAGQERRFAPVWSAMRTEVLSGQILDIHGEAGGDESVEAALLINRFKTAAYTIERPLHLGAALADADDELIAAYREFGTDIGIAFQLRDDLLGVFGDPAVTGKPSGDDLREGKRTVLIAEALSRADATAPTAAALLRGSLGTDVTPEQVAELRGILTDLGAVDAVEARITDLTDRALTALDASTATTDAKQQLRAMAMAATARAY